MPARDRYHDIVARCLIQAVCPCRGRRREIISQAVHRYHRAITECTYCRDQGQVAGAFTGAAVYDAGGAICGLSGCTRLYW